MDLCVLPQTGASEQWLVLAVVAIVVIGAGIALALSGKARRRVATGLGALAIVGALAIGGINAAPAAQADAGAADCITPGAAPAADIVVTPAFPTVVQACYAEPTITPATTTGITYTPTREGDVTTVTATAQPGYQLLAGATSTWSYDMTPPTPAPSPVDLPAGVSTVPTGGTEEQTFLEAADDSFMAALIASSAAGESSYFFDATNFQIGFEIDFVDLDGAPLPSVTVSGTMPVLFGYDAALGLYTLSVDAAFDQAAFFADLVAQSQAEIASDPNRIYVDDRQVVSGLVVGVSWDGGPVCDTQTAFVPVGVDFSAPGAGPGSAPGFAPAFGAPSLDAVTAEAPAAEAPAAETPAVEAPATEAPATEAPATEEPAAEEAEVVETPAPEVEVDAPVEG